MNPVQEWHLSLSAIPSNAKEMLLTPWKYVRSFPYLVPTGFGGSILLSSPFLVLLFRKGAVDSRPQTHLMDCSSGFDVVLWCHGNPGGWQFSYRYAMILLPWFFLIPARKQSGENHCYRKGPFRTLSTNKRVWYVPVPVDTLCDALYDSMLSLFWSLTRSAS